MDILLPLLLYLTLPPSASAMIGMSLFFGVLVTSSLFLISYGLQNPQLIALAKEELAALIFSVFIIMFWLGSDTVLNGISTGLIMSALPASLQANIQPCNVGPTCVAGLTSNHIMLAVGTLEILYQKLKAQYVDLYLFEALIGFLSTVSFPLGTPIPAVNAVSFSIAPFTGLVLLSNAHTVVVEAISYLITVIWAKQFILIFARDAIPLLLLPLGLVLRAFPFFRTTGSSLIALCFAVYFVLPFAMILSNYLIFDVYQPADFVYTPAVASYFGTSRSAADLEGNVTAGREEAAHGLLEQFKAPDVMQTASTQQACSGNIVVHALCSVKNLFVGAWSAFTGFIGTIWTIWRFMVGMTGDFFYTFFNNPAMPESASAGLYYFIKMEVLTISPFIILVMLTTVLEIIITVTMYRNISLLIGGEAEIIGLTKIV